MKKIILLLSAMALLISCDQASGEKTAYVNNSTLFKEFEAFSASTKRFERKQQQLQEEVQREGQKFQQKVQDFQENFQNMTEKEAEELQMELLQEQQRLENAMQQQETQLRNEMNQTQDSLENILMTEVKNYAENQNYTYIFGMNENYNLIYAKDSKDITKEVLDLLNKKE
ncbi:MAG TPA: OmpH family outer membrane protein [Flavobacteriaceae bacterium]|nr:OmpH family outer membrane protein [Flavobacteriaceae bacterium]